MRERIGTPPTTTWWVERVKFVDETFFFDIVRVFQQLFQVRDVFKKC